MPRPATFAALRTSSDVSGCVLILNIANVAGQGTYPVGQATPVPPIPQ